MPNSYSRNHKLKEHMISARTVELEHFYYKTNEYKKNVPKTVGNKKADVPKY